MGSADEQLSITMTGDAASVQRMFGDLDKRMKGVGKSAEKMSKTTNKGLSLSMTAALKLAGGMGLITSGIAAIGAEAQRQERATLSFLEKSATAAKRFKEELRGVAIQMNLNALQEKEAGKKIVQLAKKNAVTTSFALASAKQLASSGFDPAPILEGGALDSTLQFAVATTATGGDPTAAVKAQTQFLAGTGQGLTPKNLKALQVDLQNKFVPTNIQLSTIPNIAEQASTLTNLGVSPTDITALFATLLSSKTAGPAATSLGALADSFSGISGSPEKIKALARIGLKPTDVDFVGEDFFQIIQRFRKAFEKADPETRQGDLTKIFGRQGKRALLDFVVRPDDLKRIRRLTGDEAAFDQAVARGTTGPVAESQRAVTRLETQRVQGGGLDVETTRTNLRAEAISQGLSPDRVDILVGKFDRLIGRGGTAKQALADIKKGFGDTFFGMGALGELDDSLRGPRVFKGLDALESDRVVEAIQALHAEIRAQRNEARQPKKLLIETDRGADVPATAKPTDLEGLNQR